MLPCPAHPRARTQPHSVSPLLRAQPLDVPAATAFQEPPPATSEGKSGSAVEMLRPMEPTLLGSLPQQ